MQQRLGIVSGTRVLASSAVSTADCSVRLLQRTCSVFARSVLCNNVEALALALRELYAVVLRMKLAALTTELIAADLIERARRTSAVG